MTIDKKLLQPYLASLVVGVQIHINHVGCIAGKDTKKRLYIKRVVGGVVAYCHHCTNAGFQRELTTDGTALREWIFGKRGSIPRVTVEKAHKGFPYVYPIKNPEILTWLRNHYILTEESTVQDQQHYGEAEGGLYMINACFDGGNYAYQVRHFDGGPKYTTHIVHPCGEDVAWFKDGGYTQELYITEDYVSAYRLWRDGGFNAVALLKTSISESTISNIRRLNPPRIFIWLDPDEPGKKAATKVAQRLSYSLDGPRVANITGFLNEPKNYTSDELRMICGRY